MKNQFVLCVFSAVLIVGLQACGGRKSKVLEEVEQTVGQPSSHATREQKPQSVIREAETTPASASPGSSGETAAVTTSGVVGSADNVQQSELYPKKSIDRVRIFSQGAFPDMYYEHYGVNPTIDTEEEPVSTFSIDVDDGSYTLARAHLDRGVMPPEEAIRVEEFTNAFDYQYQSHGESDGHPFSVHAEMFPSPSRKGYHLLHLGIQGIEPDEPRNPANLVFVVDVSGSMGMENRIGLVKRALRLLVKQLQPEDSIGIVVYGSHAWVALEPTTLRHKSRILRVIDSISIGGSTNAAAGLELGYDLVQERFRKNRINRVILCSDGVANVGVTSAGGILDIIKEQADRSIYLTSVGFGLGNYNDALMEQLANHANGSYHYVDDYSQAKRVFKEQLTGTLQVIAQDVKIQVEFDPEVVERYRLIGYENRLLETEDFDNDRVDAGEIGAGHTVTALYELKLRTLISSPAEIRIRAKKPGRKNSRLMSKHIPVSVIRKSFSAASSPSKLSMAVSAFAEKLRGSYWTRHVSYRDIVNWYQSVDNNLRLLDTNSELKRLILTAESLDERADKFADQVSLDSMQFDHVPILQ